MSPFPLQSPGAKTTRMPTAAPTAAAYYFNVNDTDWRQLDVAETQAERTTFK